MSPTYRYFLGLKIFVFFWHICKIAIFVFLSIYMELVGMRYRRKVLNCKNSSKVNFKNADIIKDVF